MHKRWLSDGAGRSCIFFSPSLMLSRYFWRIFKVVPDLRKSSMNFFLNSVIWSLLLGYSNNEKKEGGPRIGYGDIRRQKGGIF